MKKFLNNIRKNSIIALTGFTVVGVLLMLFPYFIARMAGYIVGAVAIGFGVTKIIGFFQKDEAKKSVSLFGLIVGIVLAVGGVYIIAQPYVISNALISIFGAGALIYGAVKMKNALSLKKSGMSKWVSVFANALIAILIGLVFLINPSISYDLLVRLLGAGLTVIGLSDLLTFVNVTREYKTVINENGEIEGTAREIKSEDDND